MGSGKSNKSFAVILILTVAFSSLTLSGTRVAFAQQSSSGDWPMFRYDSAHNGIISNAGPTEGDKVWSFVEGHFDGSFIGSSAAIVNGVVYVGSNWNNNPTQYPYGSGNIYAFNAGTGAKIWNYSTKSSVYSSPAVVGNIMIIGLGSDVCAFDASTGTKIWSFPTGGTVNSSPNVVDGVVYVGSWDDNVYALNASNGEKLWNFTVYSNTVLKDTQNGGAIESSPAVADGAVYVGSDDGNLYALNASTGAKLWNYTTSYQLTWTVGNQVTSSPAVSGGVVYVGSVGGNIYAFNATTGAKIWSYYTGPSVAFGGGYWHGVQASPAVDYGMVYVGSVDGYMYALNASTGKPTWEVKTGAVLSSAALSNAVVYVALGFDVSALNAVTGAKIWTFTTQNQINASPSLYKGVIFIASQDGHFYAIGKPSSDVVLVVVVTVSIIIIVAVVALVFRKRLKTKPTSSQSTNSFQRI
jgi:outer membrane protein assembly factor BamB